MAGERMGGSLRGRSGRIAAIGTVTACVFGFVVAPVVGDGLNSKPVPVPGSVAASHPATSLQVAGARGLGGASAGVSSTSSSSKAGLRRITVRSRITNQEILTEEGKGTFVGIRCPAGSKAISGGVLTKYINLLVSSSAPNNPLTRKYTPGVWWLTVVNVNVDGNGGTLPWQGVVNCLSPARVGTG